MKPKLVWYGMYFLTKIGTVGMFTQLSVFTITIPINSIAVLLEEIFLIELRNFISKMEEMQYQFNYLIGTRNKKQLYYDFQLWYQYRPNYWGCINPNCNSYLSTDGNKLKEPEKKLPPHFHDRKLKVEFS